MSGLNIKELRQKGKDPIFCLQVSPELLEEIVELLLSRKDRCDSESIDLIATISNILLINIGLAINTLFQTILYDQLNSWTILLIPPFQRVMSLSNTILVDW